MKVNFNKPLKDFRGEDMKDEFGKVQNIVCARLYSSGKDMSIDDKFEAYKLMKRIEASNSDVDINDRESLLIKECCNNTLTAGAFGQIFELLNV